MLKVKQLRFHQRLPDAAVDVVRRNAAKDIDAGRVIGKAMCALRVTACELVPVCRPVQSVKSNEL
jgi:hypothetical protein